MTEFFAVPKVFESSPEMKQERQIELPWEIIEIDQSFTVPLDQGSLIGLRHKCWYMGKKLGKRFRVIQRHNCFEIGRKELKDKK